MGYFRYPMKVRGLVAQGIKNPTIVLDSMTGSRLEKTLFWRAHKLKNGLCYNKCVEFIAFFYICKPAIICEIFLDYLTYEAKTKQKQCILILLSYRLISYKISRNNIIRLWLHLLFTGKIKKYILKIKKPPSRFEPGVARMRICHASVKLSRHLSKVACF